ncbi:cell wall-binding repeat-containing protein [Peptostreptococcus faecalis]|uniref:cell wall-binding repeat-containing protein n=1 Tax=Peptostreptococcus faecalis TaxID=2045015 RepID=UPI000C79E0DD|nr:cell wall-binding repeat-containing protein [Peptostreptococcus faecalis]
MSIRRMKTFALTLMCTTLIFSINNKIFAQETDKNNNTEINESITKTEDGSINGISSEEVDRILSEINKSHYLKALLNMLAETGYSEHFDISNIEYLEESEIDFSKEVTHETIKSINEKEYINIVLNGTWSYEIFSDKPVEKETRKNYKGENQELKSGVTQKQIDLYHEKYDFMSNNYWEWAKLIDTSNNNATLQLSNVVERNYLHLMKKDSNGKSFYDYFEEKFDYTYFGGMSRLLPDQLDGRDSYYNFDLYAPITLIKKSVRDNPDQNAYINLMSGGRYPIFSDPDDYTIIKSKDIKAVAPTGEEKTIKAYKNFTESLPYIVFFENESSEQNSSNIGYYLFYDPDNSNTETLDAYNAGYYGPHNNIGKPIAVYKNVGNGEFKLDRNIKLPIYDKNGGHEDKALLVDENDETLNSTLKDIFSNKKFAYGGVRNSTYPAIIQSDLFEGSGLYDSESGYHMYFILGNPQINFLSNNINIKYLDENGKEIKNTDVLKGNEGDDFKISPPEIDGYKFKEVANGGSLTGKYLKDKEQTITLIYIKDDGNNGGNNGGGGTVTPPTKKTTAVLANGTKYTDVLTATVLANEKDCPILLTGTDSISTETLNELKRRGTGDVIISGGLDSVSKKVEEQLKDFNIVRYAGTDRYETAKEIGKQVRALTGKTDGAMLVDGTNFPDVITISALATQKRVPILITNPNKLTTTTENVIKDWNLNNIVIGGSTNSVAKSIQDRLDADLKISSVSRIGGADRYETASLIGKEVRALTGNMTDMILVDGTDFPDGITINSLAAKFKCPIHLTRPDKLTDITAKDIADWKVDSILVGGGENSVSKSIYDGLKVTNKERISGADRYSTAVKISQRLDRISTPIGK